MRDRFQCRIEPVTREELGLDGILKIVLILLTACPAATPGLF